METWRAVPSFEGLYEVSNLGQVRSFHKGHARVLQLGPHMGGYRTVHLYRDGKRRATVLHIVVAEAFCGPRPTPGHEVRHLDGDKKNCRADNLTWGTHKENEADKASHGTRLLGERTPGAKLTATAVAEIRARIGEPQADLAAEYGCTFGNISAIQRRKSWRHV